MIFSHLAQYFEKLEETSSRLSLIDILSGLFKEVVAKDIAMVCYLLQGRVAPFYEAIEIGMAEKNVAAAIARAYGVDREEVLKEYGQVGDLGLVAQGESVKRKGERGRLTIEEVFKTLTEIANTGGAGSVEKKQIMLSDLLQNMDPISAKHLVRIPIGASRLGIGDPTILDGFAQAKLGDRKLRKELEQAYNKTSDLGIIGQTLWKEGLVGVNKLDVTFGRPIRSQLAERLPDPKTILEKFQPEAGEPMAHVQYKYDGFRVQIHKQGDKVRLFSRNLEETTLMFPDIIKGVLDQIKADSVILDSEALAYNPESEEFLPFQETTKRRRKHGIEEMAKTLPLRVFVFDIMYLNGKSLMNEPLEKRIEYLVSSIKRDETLIVQPGEITDKPERIQTLFDDALTKGLEGLIVKRPDSKYQAGGRNFNWVKLKKHSSGELQDTIDCVILGYIFGKGKRADFGAGALLVGVYDESQDEFVTVSKIGTGLTDEEWREIKVKSEKLKVQNKPARVISEIVPSVWIKPEIVIEVLADEITRSPTHTAGKNGDEPGYALRFPRLVRFRGDDKKAEDATTVKELIEMFEQQFKKKA